MDAATLLGADALLSHIKLIPVMAIGLAMAGFSVSVLWSAFRDSRAGRQFAEWFDI